MKDMSEMTLEELWQLFPIFLTAPDPRWRETYLEIKAKLKKALAGKKLLRISHIGSTSVDGIWAKPIVDVLVELSHGEDLLSAVDRIEEAGFRKIWLEEDRAFLNLGYTRQGFAEKVCHVHLRRAGDHDELYFRDYLRTHGDVAKAYEALKLSLWKRYEHDRDGYTEAKGEFIRQYTEAAKRLFIGRWEDAERPDYDIPKIV